MTPDTKRHLISAGTTFATGFILGILPYLQNLDVASFGKSAAFAIVLVGIRAGIKLLVEKFVAPKAEQL